MRERQRGILRKEKESERAKELRERERESERRVGENEAGGEVKSSGKEADTLTNVGARSQSPPTLSSPAGKRILHVSWGTGPAYTLFHSDKSASKHVSLPSPSISFSCVTPLAFSNFSVQLGGFICASCDL